MKQECFKTGMFWAEQIWKGYMSEKNWVEKVRLKKFLMKCQNTNDMEDYLQLWFAYMIGTGDVKSS